MNKFLKTVFCSSILLFSSLGTASEFTDLQKSEIESIIDDYVSNHPEVLIRAMKKLEADEMAQKQADITDISKSILADNQIPSRGKSGSKHYIIEFYDYNCGYCKVMEPLFVKAQKEFDIEVRYVNVPVIREESKQSAIVGQAIFEIDKDKYFKFHDHYMQAANKAVDLDDMEKFCKSINLDWEKVVEQMKKGTSQATIKNNLDYSRTLKIMGTPYLIIDGKEYRGAITSYETLKSLFDK